MNCKVLESKKCAITQNYHSKHSGLDLVKEGYQLDYITAHTDGKIIAFQDGLGNMKGTNSYGNYVKIDHGDGYCTLYAHMKKGLLVNNGQNVKTGQRLGYMGDTGNSYGAHLHFEVWKDGKRINPIEYLNKNLPVNAKDDDVNTNKTIDELAQEVINGKWGNGADRKSRLESAGYSYSEVQNRVNEILLGNKKLKSVEEVAKEVIQGKWGNGTDRKNRLTKAGYNYREVQNRVNQMLR